MTYSLCFFYLCIIFTRKNNKAQKCYTLSEDSYGYFPKCNFEENIPVLLKNTDISVLVIQAPISDITNLKISQLSDGDLMIESQNLSEKVISLGKKTLLTHPDLKMVVILERPKRQE